MKVRRVQALAVLLALLGGLALTLGVSTTPAAAAEPQALVSIALTGMTPSLPSRDSTITLTGQVTNVTKDRLEGLQAIFWRNQAPITTAEGVEQALASDSNEPLGARRTAYFQNLTTAASPYLEPGQSAPFTLRAPVADLQLSPTDGIYLMGVHVLQVGNPFAVGRARTFVPVLRDEPEGRLQMTSLVVLSSRPSLLRRGVLVDEHLADEVQSGGRLDELLTAADHDGTSFAVDPALVDELTTMKDGYSVQTGDGPAVTGRGRADAARWLSRFAALAVTRDGFRLPYGSPDLAALVHDHQTSLLDDVVAAGRRVESTASLPLLVLPAGGYADEDTVRAAEALHPAAIVLSDASAAGDSPLLAGLDVGDGAVAPIVRYSSASSGGGGPGPDPRTTPVQLRQRALADSWVQATASASSATQGRVRLITSTKQLQGDNPGVAAPWVTRSTLSDLLTGRPAKWDQQFSYPSTASEAELTPGQLSSLRGLARRTTTYAELLVDGDSAKASGQAAVARAASATWREHDRQRRLLLGPQQAALDAVLLDGVQISSNPKVSTVAREGVEFPITVKNLLPVDPDDGEVNAVNVRLVFVSDLRQRLTIKALTICPPRAPAGETGSCLPNITAGSNVTRNAKVTARANGTVPVRAQLQTASGTPVGRPVTIDVRVTQNGTTGWAIAGAAMVVFLGGTALRIRRAGRTRAAAAADSPEPPSALTSAPPTDRDALDQASPDERDPIDA